MGSLIDYRRRIIASSPHLETASGDIVSISKAEAAPIKSCIANFIPAQSGSGDPSPSNVRTISGWTGVNINVSPTQQADDGSTYTVSWTSQGVQYCGNVNICTGVLTATMGIEKLDDIGWAASSVTSAFRAMVNGGKIPSSSQQGTGIGWCSHYKVVQKKYADLLNGEMCVNNWSMGSGYYGIVIKDTRFTDSQAFKASLNNVYLVYELNTPQTYQLTPQTIKTLRGINNIWSNQGTVQVKYWTH